MVEKHEGGGRERKKAGKLLRRVSAAKRRPAAELLYGSQIFSRRIRFIRNNIDKSFFFTPIAMMKVSKLKDLFDEG